MTEATLVKELRDKTGAGFMDCKKALANSDNNIEKAIIFLREKGLAAASKKAGREANEGRVLAYIHGEGKIGVLIEVNCETDFVARTDEFQEFVRNVAMHIAAANPRYLNKEAVPAKDIESEQSIFRKQAEDSGKKGPVIDKIIEGKINKFFEENCLVNQRYVRDPDQTIENLVKSQVAKLGENISIKRYERYQLGESTKAE
ncbi:MAG: translation elongation factor Ts [Proteobacteria bacterium]|nr:translation elongation factor Ts [Pseudomonadota bacterium]NQW45050.1 translation elongation factor Ts [Deltaproteobacteria bacterium]